MGGTSGVPRVGVPRRAKHPEGPKEVCLDRKIRDALLAALSEEELAALIRHVKQGPDLAKIVETAHEARPLDSEERIIAEQQAILRGRDKRRREVQESLDVWAGRRQPSQQPRRRRKRRRGR